MRQAGIIAAAGIYALEHMVNRLVEDHRNARKLAKGMAGIEGLSIDVADVQTDIVYFDVVGEEMPADRLVDQLEKRGVRILPVGSARLRAVTHYGISAEDVDVALEALRQVMDTA
jgi:threonine aldolase